MGRHAAGGPSLCSKTAEATFVRPAVNTTRGTWLRWAQPTRRATPGRSWSSVSGSAIVCLIPTGFTGSRNISSCAFSYHSVMNGIFCSRLYAVDTSMA
eukprot:scaffold15670_cov112-Isochrysis_galbana.AAC.2